MITVEQWHTIRCLDQRGVSRRRIATELGISRNTVDRALEGDTPPGYQRPSPVTGDGEHDDFIRAGLARGLCGSRILADLRAQRDYRGSPSSFYRRLQLLAKEAAQSTAYLRFETGPGQQAQFDWAEYRVPLGGELTKIYVYGMVLGYSRRCHWFASLSSKQPAILEAVEVGWKHFGGACRELVVDNAKSLVTKHTRNELVWHFRFAQLCGHYRVHPIAGTPRHPQGKGKVENPFGLLEARFIQGTSWPSFDAFQRALAQQEEQWEQRTHGTTGVVPTVRFEDERSELIALPVEGFIGVREHSREVSRDCLVSFEGVRYSVPAAYAGKTVWVQPSQGYRLQVLAPCGKMLASHTIPVDGTRLVVQQAHYETLRRRHQACLTTLTTRYRARTADWGEVASTFLQRFIGQHTHNPERNLSKLLELLEGVPDEIALLVLGDGIEYNLLTLNFLCECTTRRMKEVAAKTTTPSSSQMPLPDLEVERPLSAYAGALPDDKPQTDF